MKSLFAWIERGDELLQSYLGLFLTSSLLLERVYLSFFEMLRAKIKPVAA